MISERYCTESVETSVAGETEGAREQGIHNNTVDKHAGQAQESDGLCAHPHHSVPTGGWARYLSPKALICKKKINK